MMKTALLVVSFGTTHLDTMEKTITATEKKLAEAFPEYPVYRAFTSGIVRKRLEAKFDIHADSVEEALSRIAADGYGRVAVQPTLLIPGIEYDKLCAAIKVSAGALEVRMGKPLLCDDGDVDAMLALLEKAYPVDPDTILLLMGHGTDHSANGIYIRMAEKMKATSMRLSTVEGEPSFEDALAELAQLPQKKILVAPMMFVAGDHAKNDMAGNEPDSLRSMLEAKGYTVQCVIRGLGELEAVQKIYVEKAREALN